LKDVVPLGDVCDFLDSKRVPVAEELRKSGPFPYYGANGQQGWIDGFIFDEPLILLAEDGGAFGSKTKPIAYKVTGKCWVNNHAHVLKAKPNCDSDFLHRILSYYDVTPFVNGSTRQKLNKANAELIPIPLPSLDEQKRIAAVLERADHLRRTRRFARALSDPFLQSVFLQMFGDPVSNPMDWEIFAIEDVGNVTTGGTPPSAAAGMFGGSIPFATPGDLESGAKVQRTLTQAGAKKSRLVRAGSTLVCCIGATIGKTDIARTQTALNQQINAIEWDSAQVCDEFGVWLMRFMAETVASRGRSTTLPILNKSNFESLPVIRPPLEKQRQFAAVVRRFERMRAGQIEAGRQAEHLFQTLLHRAFSP